MRDEKGSWIEPKVGVDMSDSEGRSFKKDPAINVISKEEFEKRIEQVFYLLWKTLSKSFGPYGAHTLIYKYPYHHVTKDGYTIMKNLSMDASETMVDQAIADMASDICGRLNYSVGDGTTTAVISTNSIYQRYREVRDELEKGFVMPRDVMNKFTAINEKVQAKLENKARAIRSENMGELKNNIHDVVYISSNADEEITDYISELYGELGSPSITCALAPDGITKKTLVNGYKYNLVLNDRIYINSDNQTMDLEDSDIIIFSTKVTANTYKYILKPLSMESKMRGRHLIVAAPVYDEVALQQLITVDLNNEYRKEHNVNMVLTTYRAISAHTRRLLSDFAVLMNTIVIDRGLETAILDQLTSGMPIHSVINLDGRDIEGLRCIGIPDDPNNRGILYNKGQDELPSGYSSIYDNIELNEVHIDLGYVKRCSLGLQTSLFTDMVYDEARYELNLKEAEDLLEETEKKYQKLGTFNIEVAQAQERYYALKLKMGIIEVGGESELSQKLRKDAVDDAIKAANSAFNHGVVLGCNTNLIQSIREVKAEITDPVDKILVDILYEGFMDVYRTVLRNAFGDVIYELSDKAKEEDEEVMITEIIKAIKNTLDNSLTKSVDDFLDDEKVLYEAVKDVIDRRGNTVSIHDVLITYSILVNKVFDISKFEYSDAVINSVQTDQEVLRATIDLISMLIVGNQMVVTQKHNFD